MQNPVYPAARSLRSACCGFGTLGLTSLTCRSWVPRPTRSIPWRPKPPHFAAQAKRVIFLFMHGGPSQVDTFDYKPRLIDDHGKPLPFAQAATFAERQTGNLLKSPWKFAQHGQSGAGVSDLFPHVAQRVDDLCVITVDARPTARARRRAAANCTPAATRSSRPSMGSWITYGLGTENQNLPGFITICPTLAHGGVEQLELGVPAGRYQGTPIGNAGIPAEGLTIPFIENRDRPSPEHAAAASSTCSSR